MKYNEKFPQAAFYPLGELPLADFMLPSEEFECDEYLCEAHARQHSNFDLAAPLSGDIICDVCRNAFFAATAPVSLIRDLL